MKGSLARKVFIYAANAPGETQMEIHSDLIHLAKTQSNLHLHLLNNFAVKSCSFL